MEFKVKFAANSAKNVAVQVSGFLTRDEAHDFGFGPVTFIELDEPRLKITRISWVIQEKGGLYLWWDEGKTLILPLESRNAISFDGLKPPDGWDGKLWVSGFKLDEPKGFLIILECDK